MSWLKRNKGVVVFVIITATVSVLLFLKYSKEIPPRHTVYEGSNYIQTQGAAFGHNRKELTYALFQVYYPDMAVDVDSRLQLRAYVTADELGSRKMPFTQNGKQTWTYSIELNVEKVGQNFRVDFPPFDVEPAEFPESAYLHLIAYRGNDIAAHLDTPFSIRTFLGQNPNGRLVETQRQEKLSQKIGIFGRVLDHYGFITMMLIYVLFYSLFCMGRWARRMILSIE